MGADLYIRKLSDAAHDKYQAEFDNAVQIRNTVTNKRWHTIAQAEVNRLWELLYDHDGYYRDSYNDSNLLWALGKSYWTDVGDLLAEANHSAPKQQEIASDSADGKFYTLERNADGFIKCSCPAFKFRTTCKHLARADKDAWYAESNLYSDEICILLKWSHLPINLHPDDGRYDAWIKEHGEKEVLTYFETKRKQFRKFLNKALELNEPINCSI